MDWFAPVQPWMIYVTLTIVIIGVIVLFSGFDLWAMVREKKLELATVDDHDEHEDVIQLPESYAPKKLITDREAMRLFKEMEVTVAPEKDGNWKVVGIDGSKDQVTAPSFNNAIYEFSQKYPNYLEE